QDPQLVREHLDLAGRELRVHRLGRAALHAPAHEDHVLRAQRPGLLVAGSLRVGLEHDLHESLAVAQIDEDHAAMVAAPLHPATEHDLVADALRGDLARAVRAAKTGLGIEAAGRRAHAVPPLPRTKAGPGWKRNHGGGATPQRGRLPPSRRPMRWPEPAPP